MIRRTSNSTPKSTGPGTDTVSVEHLIALLSDVSCLGLCDKDICPKSSAYGPGTELSVSIKNKKDSFFEKIILKSQCLFCCIINKLLQKIN